MSVKDGNFDLTMLCHLSTAMVQNIIYYLRKLNHLHAF